jgi:hypothetical protein
MVYLEKEEMVETIKRVKKMQKGRVVKKEPMRLYILRRLVKRIEKR